MEKTKLSKLIKISLLSAIAYLIMFFELPLPFLPEYLKIDFSELPALIGAFALGPTAGVLIELIKNMLHFMINTKTGGIGELANFIVGSAMVYTAGDLYKKSKTKKDAALALVAGVLVMSIMAAVSNYYIFLPLYGVKENLFNIISYGILPFNLIKGALVSIITFFVYKKLSPVLHK